MNIAPIGPAADSDDPLRDLEARRRRLSAQLARLAEHGPRDARRRARTLAQELEALSTNVTLVGQVKAGKTALVNALAGRTDLLPTDVNPWTTVVTSVHMAPERPEGERSLFRFFDRDEWNALIEDGGRLGEMARRAEAEEELEELKRQIAEMHARAKSRLGRNFQLLIGGEHAFDRVETGITEKYVCFGEETDAGDSGRFADLTRSADLWIAAPQYPAPLTLRDTPGVNDPFLVREQTTLRCLRDSHVCLAVLSAHQALATTDLAMLRVISMIDGARLVIFVNRIDELADPAVQIPQIETRVRDTLAANGLGADARMLFGCALWAQAALSGAVQELPPASRAALEKVRDPEETDLRAAAWKAAGMPELIEAVSAAVAHGPGGEALNAAVAGAVNLAEQARAIAAASGRSAQPVDIEALRDRLDRLESLQNARMNALFQQAWPKLRARLQEVAQRCAEAEAEKLEEKFEATGFARNSPWNVDAAPLRAGLRNAYDAFGREAAAFLGKAYGAAADSYRTVWTELLAGIEAPQVQPPRPPQTTAPVAVGATISIDMNGAWWSSWLGRRREMRRQVEEVRRVIIEESAPLIRALEVEHVLPFFMEAEQRMKEFAAQQRGDLDALAAELERDAQMDDPARLATLADIAARCAAELETVRQQAGAA